MPLFSLAWLFEQASASPRGRVIAVVTDASAPYRKGPNKKFILKAKVIDRSFCEGDCTSAPKKYCTIFFFGKGLSDLPRLLQVGDILLL